VEAAESDHAAQLHERIRAHRYSPRAAQGGSEHELAEESARWLARLPPSLLRRALGVVLMALVAGLGQPLGAQELSSDDLYAEGSYEAAALLQTRLVGADRISPAAWYNLGAMRWMAQHDAGAAAAWLEALRLAPRNATVRRGWSELALRHQQVRDWEPAVPVTPEELIVAGMALWWLACLVGVWKTRRRRGVMVLASLAVITTVAGIGLRAGRDRAEGFTTTAVPLRAAPHGLAQPLGTVDGVTLVQVEGVDGAWLRIRDPNGRPGWVPATSVVRLRGLD
jgi:hypothetical protein